jgi:hypothetical protein
VERSLGRGQGYVHDRVVQNHHQLRDAEHGEDPPPQAVVQIRVGRGRFVAS